MRLWAKQHGRTPIQALHDTNLYIKEGTAELLILYPRAYTSLGAGGSQKEGRVQQRRIYMRQ